MNHERMIEILRNAMIAYEFELEQQDYESEEEMRRVLLNEFHMSEEEHNYIVSKGSSDSKVPLRTSAANLAEYWYRQMVAAYPNTFSPDWEPTVKESMPFEYGEWQKAVEEYWIERRANNDL